MSFREKNGKISSMGLLQYREVDWDDLGGDEQPQSVSWRKFLVWCFAALFALASILFLLLPGDLRLPPDELAAKYPRSYAWLNRCDMACEQKVNTSYLALQRHCSALDVLFSDHRHPYLFFWRLAVDDRASALGCPGFPRDLRSLRSGAQQAGQTSKSLEEKERGEREQRMLDEQSQKVMRYEQSLAEGRLLQFVSRIVQDPADPGTVTITLAPAWERLPESRRTQMQDVLWQKWAVIYSPANPTQSRAIFRVQE